MSNTNTAEAPAAVDNSQVHVPFGVYKLRCLECKRGNSRNNNPQFVMSWEICEHKEQKYNGIKVTKFRSLTDKSLFFVNEERQAIGLPQVKESDLATLDANDYVGATGYSTVKTITKEQKDEETGEVLVNPNTGDKLVDINRELVQWCKR